MFVSTDCTYVKMTSYCLNPNLVINLWANVVLQSIITFIANLFVCKNCIAFFLVHLLVHIYVFYDLNDILLGFLTFYDLISRLYVFHLATIFHHDLLLVLCHFHNFSADNSHIYILYSTEVLRFFYFFFHLIIFS